MLANAWCSLSCAHIFLYYYRNFSRPVAGPVAQSVERWNPCGESTVAGRSQAKSVRGPAVRGYVRTLNVQL